jgi:Tfp pilus assembly protein PilZ
MSELTRARKTKTAYMLYMKYYFIPRQTENNWKLPQEFTLKLALFATPFIPVSLL